MELKHNGFEAGKSIPWGIGRGGNLDFVGPIAISGLKEVSISRAHPFQCPS
jgi:hypothetical protein